MKRFQVLNHGNLESRLFPLVMPDARIFSPLDSLKYVNYWTERAAESESELDKQPNPAAKFRYEESLRDYREISEKIQDFMTWVADKNVLSLDMHLEAGFEDLFGNLKESRSCSKLKIKLTRMRY